MHLPLEHALHIMDDATHEASFHVRVLMHKAVERATGVHASEESESWIRAYHACETLPCGPYKQKDDVPPEHQQELENPLSSDELLSEAFYTEDLLREAMHTFSLHFEPVTA